MLLDNENEMCYYCFGAEKCAKNKRELNETSAEREPACAMASTYNLMRIMPP